MYSVKLFRCSTVRIKSLHIFTLISNFALNIIIFICIDLAGLTSPSFISSWVYMKTYNPLNCQVTITHNFGEVPIYVDVQVRTMFLRQQVFCVCFLGGGGGKVTADSSHRSICPRLKHNVQSELRQKVGQSHCTALLVISAFPLEFFTYSFGQL